MATFQDFSLIKNEVKFIKNRNNIESISKAFIFMVLEKLYPDIELEDAITDGERDFCIDAYHIDESKKEINIFQFKYTEDFEIARKKDALKDRDISDFILKMERIWDKDRSVLRESNNKTANAIKEIWKALEEGFVDTKIWFISNYFKTISNKTKIKNTEKILKEKFRAELKIITLDNLITLIFQTKFKPINIKIQLKGRNYFEDSAGGIRALIGEINALNFLQSIMDDEENLKEEIFNENIRVYLRQSTKINKQIYLTIKKTEDNHKFFFYNNGITAICDEFNYTPTDGPVVDLKNFQIVNGGQTIHSLYEAYKNGLKENVKNIYLLLRICEVKNREIGQAIARYTNTQNPVRSRDVMSNDPIQIKLQQQLNRLGWWYERKKYEFRERKDINQEKKIDAEKIGQIILSFYLEKPGSAKNRKQEIFGDFYNEIFDENKINAEYVLLPFLLYKDIEKDIKKFKQKVNLLEKQKKMKKLSNLLSKYEFLYYAHYYLLLLLKLLAENEKIPLELENKEKIFKNYNRAKNILSKIIQEKKKDPKFSMPHLFKGDELVKVIKEKIK